MRDFVFHNPTKILFGRGRLEDIGSEAALWGSRALLLYGRKSCHQYGVHARVCRALEAAGVAFAEYGGIYSNPLLSQAREAIAVARDFRAELLVAVGGGSVIDTAKAVSAGLPVAHDVWKFFTGKKGLKEALPLVTALTIPGSGSEANSGMVLTNEVSREKFGFGHRLLFPRVSILDPELTCTVPPDYTAYGAVDAVAHVLEFYLTTEEHDIPVQERFMEGLIENAMVAGSRCLRDPLDINARANLMWTASLALNGLSAAGLGRVGLPAHLIAHSLGALYNLPHGACLALTLPAWMQDLARRDPRCAERISQLSRRIFPELQGKLHRDINLVDQQAGVAAGINQFRAWMRSIGVPLSLTELGIAADAIPELAENTRSLARVWRLTDYPPERVRAILEYCL